MIKKSSAFTLIEILVVATIIIVLTTIGIASFSTANKSARDAKRKSDLETIRQSMVLYKTQNGGFPAGDAATVKTALEGGFITPPLPVDPVGGASFQVGNTTATTFCFCATQMETTKGNKATRNCTTNDWNATSTGAHYCVRQP